MSMGIFGIWLGLGNSDIFKFVRQDLRDFQDGFVFIAFQMKAMKGNPPVAEKPVDRVNPV